MPAHSLSKLLCLFFFTSFFLTATCLADESDEATSQPPVLLNAETYGVSDGLSQSTVTSVAEDADGYIWIGTLNGLNRFDGKEFKQFYANDETGLKSSFIRSVFYDNKKNILLVGTDEDLYQFDATNEKFLSLNIKKYINNIDNYENNILVGTPDDTFIIDDSGKLLKKVSSEGIDVKNTLSIKDNIFLLSRDGDLIKNNKIIKKNINLITKFKDKIYTLSDKNISFIENDETQKFYSDSDYIFSGNEKLYSIRKNSLYQLYENGESKFIGEISAKNQLNNIFISRRLKNSIFISNLNEGFILIKDASNIINRLSALNSPVWSIKSNNNQNYVISDQSSKIKIYDKNLHLEYVEDTEIDGAKSSTLINNELYIGMKNGLFILNINTKEKQKILNTPISVIRNILNKLIVGTPSGYVYIINPETNYIENKLTIDNNNPIFDISNYNNEVIIASQGGIFNFDIESPKEIKQLYSSDIVFCATSDEKSIFFGTTHGIYRHNKSSKENSLLFSNKKPIFSIIKTHNNIVASSLNEILIINKNQNNNEEEYTTFPITTTNGSQVEYNTQSIAKYGKGLILGGIEGISYVDLEKMDQFIKSQRPPKTLIKSLLIFNIPQNIDNIHLEESISKAKKITLKYSEYPFTLQFISPTLGISNTEYQYRLKGLSDTWISAKNINSATYTNLSPGNYEFNVYAINPITGEKGIMNKLEINITPPWWLSSIAKITYILLLAFVIFIITKIILRRREIQRQIALSEERLKLSLWGSGDEMWDWDIESGKIYRSNIWGSLEFPRDGQRSGQKGEESNIHPQDQERVRDALNRHFYGETDHFEATYRVRSKNGEWLWILDRAKIVERDDKDHALRMTGTIKNISSFKTAEEQLRLFERAIENISEGVFILDTDFNFVELNEAACNITRYTKEQSIGRPILFEKYSADYNKQIKQLLRQQGQWNTEIESIRGDGSVFLMELTIDAIYDEQGLLTHYVGVFSDISHRKQQEEELRRLTNNDLLTGLPNRSNLQVTLENLVKKDHHHTLMILDLDNFKKINDSLGHQVGDDLLCQVSSRIAGIIPKHTSLYRLGGDEFAILVDKNPDIGSSALIANDVIEAFNEPFTLSGEDLVVGVSIGIVLYPEDEQNEQALLRKADIAMYHAKSAGGNRYQFYSESLNRNALRQLEVESLIREGLKDDLFEVYFQPKISLRTGKLAGMEALVRLNHPQYGLIPPVEFIPLAEETGLIVEVGDVVLKKACFAAQKWREDGLFTGRVAVNLSSRQFALPDLQTRIESILRLTRLPANNLELEITEGTVIKQPEKAIKVMQQLTRMGISLALDDFGTGYSSLSYLKRFPIHTLKIDKAFVDDIDKSDRDLKMVDSIITIAHNMGLSVVGEGVEQAAQLNILRALNCEEIQGFIYSKAISENEFTEYLKQDNTISTNQWDGTN
ncbi:EAL domain-containing protein [Shewanella dokdonensis]|uniref:EAL domain-containing protein n=1 Tax=Shewanella dokdonensis TaxID=712036 RepID=UPI00200C19B3|nr:EAL domain-containing protein [Shewanella dokdonensis]MCL1075006.1 EAL domain-containing protein [Shewanella dokdonensis]